MEGKKSAVQIIHSFPKFPRNSVIFSDFDDTMLRSRSTMAIQSEAKTGQWKDIPDTMPREVIGEVESLFENCEKGLNGCVILTAAEKARVLQEWKLATGKEWPVMVKVISAKEKGSTLLSLLQESSLLQKPRNKQLIYFVDDADVHIQQVLAVKSEVEKMGFVLCIFQLVE